MGCNLAVLGCAELLWTPLAILGLHISHILHILHILQILHIEYSSLQGSIQLIFNKALSQAVSELLGLGPESDKRIQVVFLEKRFARAKVQMIDTTSLELVGG